MVLSKGDKAPSFTLRDTDKKEVSLSDYSGEKLLLLFFPLAFTSVCTDELCGVRDDAKFYADLDVNILAISVDSLFSLGKFKEEQKYNFPLLSDFNKEVCRSYGTLYETFVLDMKGVSKRAAFVIDKNGKVRYEEILENAGELPNFGAIKEALGQI